MSEGAIGLVGRGAVLASLARAVRERPGLRLVGQAEPGALPVGADVVVCAGLYGYERVSVAAMALDMGCRLAVPPLPAMDERGREALASGLVVQVSPLLGYAPLRELAERVHRGELGRRYGLFAGYHFARNAPTPVDDAFADLLHYALEALERRPVEVYARRSALCGDQADAWHAVLRLEDETLVTLEAVAALPADGPEAERLLVEATGSDAVIRAEPTRQAVVSIGRSGLTQAVPWMPEPGERYLEAALTRLEQPDPPREVRTFETLRALWAAAAEGSAMRL